MVAGSHSQPEFVEFMMQWLFDIYLSKMANHLMIFLVLDTKSSIPGMMSIGDFHRNL